MTKPCPCGSGLPRTAHSDGHGIFLFFACAKCFAGKRSKYRPDIFTRYTADEPIEAED